MVMSVIGGDMRIAHLCSLLSDDGHEVKTFALDKAPKASSAIAALTPESACSGADCVILPLPVCTAHGMLNAPLSDRKYPITDILSAVGGDTVVCAGRIDSETSRAALAAGVQLTDYFAREEMNVCNALATAEGALELIMRYTAITVCSSRVLVIGYGRIGKLLSRKLSALDARVSVSARKSSDKAWIRSLGMQALDSSQLSGCLSEFDTIVNTVPSGILGEALLSEVKKGALCLDLASIPGGIDIAAANEMGLTAIWALGLPGEAAPVSAAEAIRDTVYNILKEQGRYV